MTTITEGTGAVNSIVRITILASVLPLLGVLFVIMFTVIGLLMCYRKRRHRVSSRVCNTSEDDGSTVTVEIDSQVENGVFVQVINLENRNDDEIVRQSIPGERSYENEQQVALSKDSVECTQDATSKINVLQLQAKDEDKHSIPPKDDNKPYEYSLNVEHAQQAVPTEEYTYSTKASFPKEHSNLQPSNNTAIVHILVQNHGIERLSHMNGNENGNAALLEPHKHLFIDERVSAGQLYHACNYCSIS